MIAGPAPIDETIRVQIKEPEWNAKLSRMDTRKQLVEYTDTDETQVMRNNLIRINQAISSRWIDLELSDDGFVVMQSLMRPRKNRHNADDRQLNLTKTQLYRVFNDPEFKTGGRFYGGWWQNIPKRYRKDIFIDDQSTVEVDYKSIHIMLLYAKLGLDMDEEIKGEDAYTLQRTNS